MSGRSCVRHKGHSGERVESRPLEVSEPQATLCYRTLCDDRPVLYLCFQIREHQPHVAMDHLKYG